jgi:hypothetical protein
MKAFSEFHPAQAEWTGLILLIDGEVDSILRRQEEITTSTAKPVS